MFKYLTWWLSYSLCNFDNALNVVKQSEGLWMIALHALNVTKWNGGLWKGNALNGTKWNQGFCKGVDGG